MAEKKDIKNLSMHELEGVVHDMGEGAYRGRQLFSWIYQKGASSFGEIGNLPKKLIDKLKETYYLGSIELSERLRSSDKTEKFLFRLKDGNYIETVLIPSHKRSTLCISSQVGCKFGCLFCASGLPGFIKDLTVSEIVDQVLFLRYRLNCDATNYVFMGMGEPLDNYENVSKAILIMNEGSGLNIGARRITVSTCGLVPGIDRLSGFKLQVNLSVSLHAANDRLRNELAPINKKYPIAELIKACLRYRKKTNRLVTLEYVLLNGKNHSTDDAERLTGIVKEINAKLNLINYSNNSIRGFSPLADKEVSLFIRRLERARVKVTLRKSMGKDIKAACGQLAGILKRD